tara:strand:- start:180 stop:1115 length:936 start_codon:yes stop_codon:yes gene_type:complete
MIKNFVSIFFIFFLLSLNSSCSNENNIDRDEINSDTNNNNDNDSGFVPSGYSLTKKDDFNAFNPQNWSKGLTHDTNPDIRMKWNKNTGGENLLNDNYAGYLMDNNVYVKDGLLFLENKKESISGIDPAGEFDYSTGWINSLQKINFNGSENAIYIELKAKFPKGDKVWPAIWLIDDSENRVWPPEIDIWEYFGKFFKTNRKDEMWMRYIYGLWNDKYDHSTAIENFQSTYSSSSQFHIYGFNWTDIKMKWFIDGQLVHTKTRGIEVPNSDWPKKTMCLVMNNGLLRVVDEGNTIFPNSLIIDYIKVYQKDN